MKDYWSTLKIRHFTELASTQDIAKKELIAQPTRAVLVLADQQRQGRGQGDKSFYSRLDTGLYLSIGMPLQDMPLRPLTLLPGATALAVCLALEAFHCQCQIKWPNDLILDHRKVGGILTEIVRLNDIDQGVIIGIGLNIAGQLPEEKDLEYAGTIWGELAADHYQREDLVKAILTQLAEGFEQTTAHFLSAYQARLYGRYQTIDLPTPNTGEKKVGQIIGIDHHGRLLVQHGQSVQTYHQVDISLSSQSLIAQIQSQQGEDIK